ncbi:NDR1/HIN1-like protein 13 [Oryza glaberrima]|uniref:Late embryogenesis abundant protein LEA-2 subgroup domain-containing protein n=1 Tax=Oryza glaberrima TaxID=4538 RepID=I1PT78_ORYGL|nr:NDR1/HIN1-like protein 13 [Oryza glaberrima]
MADRVYPAAKPNPPPAMANAGGGGATASFPAPKSQMYQRPIYRPQEAAAKRRRGRSCRCSFCCCFCWALLVVILLALVAAVAGGAFYLLYRPHRPSFTVSSVKLTALNLSSSPTSPSLTDSIQLTVTAKNPNKKVVYLYDDFSFSASTAANAVPLGAATSPGFTHDAGNTTVFTATIAANAVAVDPASAASDIKKSGAFSVAVDAETRAGVRVGSLKTKKIGIQVHCEGIKVTPPPPAAPPRPKAVKGKNGTVLAPAPAPADSDTAATTAATVSTAAHSCKVRVRVKIWKWTF